MARGPLPPFPPRARDAHKGDFGKVLVVAGSRGMAGAAVLASEAAYRAGAGLVFLAVPDSIADIVAARQVCAIVLSLPDRSGRLAGGASEEIAALAERADVVAIGPGLTAEAPVSEEIRRVVPRLPRPVILDADGLNAFPEGLDLLAGGSSPRVLTPHAGELARLLGRPVGRSDEERRKAAAEAARRSGAVVLLKGHRTIVTDGTRFHVNRTGNPGMATGGTGDVLTGVVAALAGQGLSPFDAAALGAHLHGRAGDLAARRLGEASLMATDLLDFLPEAIRTHQRRRR